MPAKFLASPKTVIWQMTYACQLRCTHCYTESGRRAAEKPASDVVLAIAEKIAAVAPDYIVLAGGEPLLVPELFAVLERLRATRSELWLFTNGIGLSSSVAERLSELDVQVNVSVDGATAATHDRIRGRSGAFSAALQGLRTLDATAAVRRRTSGTRFRFGIDYVIMRSNLAQVEDLLTVVVPQMPELFCVQLGAVIPTGLASSPSFAEHELLSNSELARLGSAQYRNFLSQLAPASLAYVTVTNNLYYQMHSGVISEEGSGQPINALEVEPNGAVRCASIYEGAVGSILTDDLARLWQRSEDRANDPVYIANLEHVTTAQEWASAVRRIDRHFASPRGLVRLRKRDLASDRVSSSPAR